MLELWIESLNFFPPFIRYCHSNDDRLNFSIFQQILERQKDGKSLIKSEIIFSRDIRVTLDLLKTILKRLMTLLMRKKSFDIGSILLKTLKYSRPPVRKFHSLSSNPTMTLWWSFNTFLESLRPPNEPSKFMCNSITPHRNKKLWTSRKSSKGMKMKRNHFYRLVRPFNMSSTVKIIKKNEKTDNIAGSGEKLGNSLKTVSKLFSRVLLSILHCEKTKVMKNLCGRVLKKILFIFSFFLFIFVPTQSNFHLISCASRDFLGSNSFFL